MSENSQNETRGSVTESFLIACGAACFFVTWGVWANWEHGWANRIQVGFTQAMISFASTFGLSEWLRFLAKSISRKFSVSWIYTSALGWLTANSAILSAHLLFGTPDVLQTMTPGLLTSIAYCLYYGRRMCQPDAN